ncbi:MAG: MBOAT family protein, partial [Lachnospiraceae bacterium]|nr:MBOAT family protein [Lachnospiraceae bacterium]
GLSELCAGGLLTLGLDLADYGILFLGLVLLFAVELMGRGGSVRERFEEKPGWLRYLLLFALFLLVIMAGVYGHGYDASRFIYNRF